VETLSHSTDIHALSMNEIGRIDLVLQKPIATDLFDDAPATGAFVLIDEATHHTVAAGMVRAAT
jgi:sulfate adenylyltransferase subunit 1